MSAPKPQSKIHNPKSAISFDLNRLRTSLKPFRLHWFPRLRSTNDHAAELRRKGKLYAPALVLSGRQTAGRGRGDHVWWSSPGCITATFVFPADEQLAPHHVPLIAGLALRNICAQLTGCEAIKLKWPNDLLFHERKIGGLLCERIRGADLIGMGLNVNLNCKSSPRYLREHIASLSLITGYNLDLNEALSAIAAALHMMIAYRSEYPFTRVLRDYDNHHALIGKKVSVVNAGTVAPLTGRCEGLDFMGRLLLRNRTRLERVIAGHVRVL